MTSHTTTHHGHDDLVAAVHDLDTATTRLWRQAVDRTRLLLDRLTDGGLDQVVPELVDETVFHELGRTRHPAYPHVEIWLVTAYLFKQGCYADPVARAASPLPTWVSNFADRHHDCPPGCRGDGPATGGGCDRCEEFCGGGSHQVMARFSRALARILASRA
ncbi:hypothetical protein [Kitasatospora sp. NPDC001175]|uniref:hypothetical protein n=1 Tax=Kitasatospora sp. NPDC001175 TaxID=3157103 RepID=UPI003CFC003C